MVAGPDGERISVRTLQMHQRPELGVGPGVLVEALPPKH